ncbi:MAG TPA: hypothetical protein VGS41_08470 [Chthonomonadales bacterium]|nr:hypothetical protein [Chthonomonadales bacterium]
MARHFLWLTVGATGLALCACAGEYARYYEPAPHGSLVPSQGSPLFKYSRNPDRDGKQLAREGYVLIGSSCFLAGSPVPSMYQQAMTQGMKVGAAVVLLHIHFTPEDWWVFTSYWAYPVDKQETPASSSSLQWEGLTYHCR